MQGLIVFGEKGERMIQLNISWCNRGILLWRNAHEREFTPEA